MRHTKILGIDIAKTKFDVALIVNDSYKTKMFSNNLTGFTALSEWLHKQGVTALHACMEATSRYGEALATYLFSNGFTVSVVNPAQVKYLAQACLARNKNDTLDAKIIARFCEIKKPKAWKPTPAPIAELHALVQRVDALLHMQTQEKNRRDTTSAITQASLSASLKFLDSQIKTLRNDIDAHIKKYPDLARQSTLLQSINGIGKITAATILAMLPDINNFSHQNQVVAFVGLNPRQKQSGSSIHGRTTLSKTGHAALRKALFLPAMVALQHNSVFQLLKARLSLRLKSKMCIIGAAMRKLLVIIYGILKSNKPFEPGLAMPK